MNCLLWNGRVMKDALPYFHPDPYSEILAIVNFRRYVRIAAYDKYRYKFWQG